MDTWQNIYSKVRYNGYVKRLDESSRRFMRYLDVLDIALRSHEEEFRRLLLHVEVHV